MPGLLSGGHGHGHMAAGAPEFAGSSADGSKIRVCRASIRASGGRSIFPDTLTKVSTASIHNDECGERG